MYVQWELQYESKQRYIVITKKLQVVTECNLPHSMLNVGSIHI